MQRQSALTFIMHMPPGNYNSQVEGLFCVCPLLTSYNYSLGSFDHGLQPPLNDVFLYYHSLYTICRQNGCEVIKPHETYKGILRLFQSKEAFQDHHHQSSSVINGGATCCVCFTQLQKSCLKWNSWAFAPISVVCTVDKTSFLNEHTTITTTTTIEPVK